MRFVLFQCLWFSIFSYVLWPLHMFSCLCAFFPLLSEIHKTSFCALFENWTPSLFVLLSLVLFLGI